MKKSLSKKSKIILAIAASSVAILLILFWVGLLYININSVDAGSYDENAGTKFIAHRGYSDKYFQNTVQAFRAAAKENFFQGVETDVRMTVDGVFVCSHDDNPFEDKSVLISASTYDEIKDLKLDMSAANANADVTLEYRIARLSDFLTIVSGAQKTAYVEIKQDFTKEQSKELVNFVYKYISWRRVCFCGFSKKQMEYINDEFSYADIELFTKSKTKAFFYVLMGYNVGIRYDQIKNDKPINRAHKNDCFYNAWTVSDAETAKKLISYGVDYITCDGVLEI